MPRIKILNIKWISFVLASGISFSVLRTLNTNITFALSILIALIFISVVLEFSKSVIISKFMKKDNLNEVLYCFKLRSFYVFHYLTLGFCFGFSLFALVKL